MSVSMLSGSSPKRTYPVVSIQHQGVPAYPVLGGVTPSYQVYGAGSVTATTVPSVYAGVAGSVVADSYPRVPVGGLTYVNNSPPQSPRDAGSSSLLMMPDPSMIGIGQSTFSSGIMSSYTSGATMNVGIADATFANAGPEPETVAASEEGRRIPEDNTPGTPASGSRSPIFVKTSAGERLLRTEEEGQPVVINQFAGWELPMARLEEQVKALKIDTAEPWQILCKTQASEMDLLKKEMMVLNTRIEHLQETVREKVDTIKDLERDLSSMTANRDAAQAAADDASSERDGLKSQLDEANARITELSVKKTKKKKKKKRKAKM